MKRFFLFLCLFTLLITLIACGGETIDSTAAETNGSTAEQTTVTTATTVITTTVITTTEADTTYEDILYDTAPITGEVGEPYQANWNPYLLSPLIEEDYEEAFHRTITAILNRRLTVTYESLTELHAVRDNLFYEFPPSALCDITADDATLTLYITYRYDRATHLEKVAAFGKRVEEILSTYLLFGDGEAEKAIMLYHAVAYNVDYIKTDYEPWQINAYYALTENLAICYSFSDAYNYLLRQVGVEAWLLKSYRPSDRAKHGWSLIKIGKDYYHCDTTWEYNYCNGVGFYYFAMNDTRRASAIALSDATMGEGVLKTDVPFSANGTQFVNMSGDKFHTLTWTLDREKRVIRYNGKEYPYDNQ